MKRLFRLQFTAFVRRPALLGAAAVFLALVAGLGVYEVILWARYGYRGFDALGFSTRYLIMWPAFFVVVSYEFMSQARLANMEEAVEACAQEPSLHRLATTLVPLSILLVSFVAYLSLRVAVVFFSGMADLLLGHTLKAAAIDVLAPALIATMTGAALASHVSRFAGYASIALFLFLIGPFSELIPSVALIATVGSGRVLDLYPVFTPFWILPPNPTWYIEASYGFPMEAQRWAIAGLWLSLLGTLEIPRLAPRPNGKALRAAGAVAVAAFLVGTFLPGSVLRHERGPGSTSNVGEEIYYEHRAHDASSGAQDAPPTVRATSYDMEMTVARDLRARVTISLARAAQPGAHPFTLYHGYQISRVTDERGNRVRIRRSGDRVDLLISQPTARLTFWYRGSGGPNYANSQGVCLPWYFPYYPVPGARDLWDEQSHLMRCEPLHDDPVDFVVTFRCRAPVFSNLERKGARHVGRSRAAVFIGGLVRENIEDGIRTTWFPASGYRPEHARPLVDRILHLQAWLQGDRSDDPISKVMQIPESVSAVTGCSAYRMGDTVFATVLEPDAATQAVLGAASLRADRRLLRETLVSYLADPERFLLEHGDAGVQDSMTASSGADTGAPDPAMMSRLLREMIGAFGEDAAVRRIFEYLGSDDPRSALEFLHDSLRSTRQEPMP
ncbi:MAG: hypothetical protein N3B11_07960 [Coriobacteriia bacterium]|nr:hypothetical protein [Coriobacteriia bacterium]